MAKPNPPRSPRQFPGPGELERMVCDAINVADNDGTVAQLWNRAHREPEIDEQKLWERPILKHIYTASLSRQMDHEAFWLSNWRGRSARYRRT